MYDIISGFFGILKVDPISTDNNVFRLHYKATTFILIIFAGLLIQRQYFGDPIDCMTNKPIDIIDTYCWIQSTFSLAERDHIIQFKHPGVHGDFSKERRNHTYYQWITLVLVMQAGLFYFPHYLWEIWEGEKIKKLVEGMHVFIMNQNEIEAKKKFLVSYFMLNLRKQDLYAYTFMACEMLNFINVVAQIFLTDLCVGYEFSTYGLQVLSESQKPFVSRDDSLEYVFPKVTKCTFSRVGPSGTHEYIDALCVLPLNVFIEKIYIFLWFWFILIAVVSGLGLIFRLCTFSSSVRKILLKSKAKISDSDAINLINKRSKLGDWFLLYQIAKNMEENTFKGVISDLAKALQHN